VNDRCAKLITLVERMTSSAVFSASTEKAACKLEVLLWFARAHKMYCWSLVTKKDNLWSMVKSSHSSMIISGHGEFKSSACPLTGSSRRGPEDRKCCTVYSTLPNEK